MTKVTLRELTAIRMTLEALNEVGIKVDEKTTRDDLFNLAARMLSYTLGKTMTQPELKAKMETALNRYGWTIESPLH